VKTINRKDKEGQMLGDSKKGMQLATSCFNLLFTHSFFHIDLKLRSQCEKTKSS